MGRARPLSGGLLVALLVGVVTGCGLPDPRPLLPPPIDPSASDAADTFSFSHPTGAGSDRVRSVETFGYEVYYRFSRQGDATDHNLQDIAQLRASGFVSLRKAGDRQGVSAQPLIVVSSSARADHRVTLSFAALGDGADPRATLNPGGSISLRRGVANITGAYERFECEGFEAAQPDVLAFAELPQVCAAGLEVQLEAYAVAYGRDADRRAQFSDALYLGSIDVQVP